MFTTYRVPPVSATPRTPAVRPLSAWFSRLLQTARGRQQRDRTAPTGQSQAARQSGRRAAQGC